MTETMQGLQFSQLLHNMVEKEASDLFISAGAMIQIRINGALQPVTSQPLLPGQARLLAEQFLSKQQLTDFDQTQELNIGHAEQGVGRFRVNFFKQRGEIAIVVRHIKTYIPKPQDLGLPEVMTEQIMAEHGLILVCGATGTGKSTTLASLVDYRGNREINHIITLEDPIEYMYQHGRSIINQREIGVDTASWEEAMKNVLRQSPDVVVIGEIRNHNAQEQAIALALTGHVCLSTLHATNSIQAFERILNYFPKNQSQQVLYDLSHCLRAILCQRLVPGIDGRQHLVSECLINSSTVSDIIKRGQFFQLKEILENSDVKGMHTFDQSLLQLYKAGKISEKVALRYADSEHDLKIKIQIESGNPQNSHPQEIKLRAEAADEEGTFYNHKRTQKRETEGSKK